MSAVQISFLLLLTIILANSIDPRFLRGRARTTAQPENDRLNDLVHRVADLEAALATEHLNTQAQIARAEQHISDLQASISEGCSCNPVDDREPDTADRGHADGGWVNDLDQDEIKRLIDGFYTRSSSGNRDRGGVDNEAVGEEGGEEDNTVELRPEAVTALSRAFAQLLTREVTQELGGESLIQQPDMTPTEETEEYVTTTLADTREVLPTRHKPQRFPFRPSRSLRHPRKASIPDDASVEQVSKQLEEVFTDLLRSSKKGAFSAIRTRAMMGLNNVSQVITYQKVQTNKGKQLNRKAGFFNCTIPGIYYFSYTMRSYDDKLIGVVLMMNQEPVVAITTDASRRKVMQSQSVMLTLKKGDLVWLLLGPSEDFGIYGNTYNYITFNGVYLFK